MVDFCTSPTVATLILTAAATTNAAYAPAPPPARLPETSIELSVILMTSLSSITRRADDLVTTALAEDVTGPAGGFPAGTMMTGRVRAALRANDQRGRVDTHLLVGGKRPIGASLIEISDPGTSGWEAGPIVLCHPQQRATASRTAVGGVLTTPPRELVVALGTRPTVKLLGPARA
jgi:hypothetical protein